MSVFVVYFLFSQCYLLMYLLVNQSRNMKHTHWGNVPCLVEVSYSFFFRRKHSIFGTDEHL